jgi:hypothetical protein
VEDKYRVSRLCGVAIALLFLTYVADCQPGARILRCCIAFAVPRVCVCVCVSLSLSLSRSSVVCSPPAAFSTDRNAFDSCTLPPPSQFLGAGFFEHSENFAIDSRNSRKEEEKEEAEE